MAYSSTYIYAPLKWISAGLISLALSASASAQPMPGGDRGPIPAGVITLSEAQVPFSVTLPGRAIAYEEVNIRPRVDGTISEIPYEAGRKVEKGDVLFRIEGDTFEVDVAAAEAEVARAEAAVTAAEATLSRYERLQGTGVTIEDVENARVTVLQNKAELSSANAKLKLARLNLERTEIRSPITGIVAVPEVSVGAVVTANQADALTTVTRLDPIYIDVEESSKRLAEVRALMEGGTLQRGEGLDLTLTLENGVQYDQKGTLESPGTRVSTTTGSFEFRIRFNNPERHILPGQFLRVEIELGTTRAVMVPQGATSRAADGTLTAFVAVDGKAEQRELTEHGSYQNAWIVTEGITPGEALIVDGLMAMRDGADIQPVSVEISENGVVTDAKDASSDES
ncbi:efflux RND transporter periplasmic adaptor subunit [Tritonibacter mobilis]|uniref:efflux RND transporter periplasmic adaptor subunit n=1 Tax=Tritonibacter mobilis TaxID=379347 RepID=UPI000806E8D5|nr:efflux RND transporter periplasmic adaptor subunit [Tritonibacter mobilis]MBU3036563.1 efflux RND transporter periplasmic adaptor subunit [Tritonibacter mobilis]WHQ84300.1 efflux RND transporter periplasmic adaptor subunit [Tritonibacter mobilis]